MSCCALVCDPALSHRPINRFCRVRTCFLIALALAVPAVAPRAYAQSPPGLGLQVSGGYAQLSITGEVGTLCTIQYATNLGPLDGWLVLTNFPLLSNPAVFDDTLHSDWGFCAYRASSQLAPTNVVATNIFYVDNAGNDSNAGTNGAPWKTVQYGLNQIKAGQVLKLTSGQTFAEPNLVLTNSGASGSPIVIATTDTGRAILAVTNSHGLAFSNLDFISILATFR